MDEVSDGERNSEDGLNEDGGPDDLWTNDKGEFQVRVAVSARWEHSLVQDERDWDQRGS